MHTMHSATAELILALDVPNRAAALRLIDQLPSLRWVKVGSVLMTAEGPALVRELCGRGLSVFLDLKWHDIPNTVSGAVRAAALLGVGLVTVHGLGGRAMLQAAASAAGPSLRVIGVTVLTSHDASELALVTGRDSVDLEADAERLAVLSVEAGLAGVVCSPLEIARLRQRLGPGPLIVVPGIRGSGEASHDQRRVATAREAVTRGATHLVVGRPIAESRDPAAALSQLQEEIAGA